MYTDHIHKSERLVYEAIDPEKDIEWFQTLRSNPSVAQWQKPFIIVPWTKARAAQFVETDGALIQVVIKIPNVSNPALPANPIGFMRLVPPGKGLEHHRRAEFIISLIPEYHGKGYGTEALQWLLDVGFKRANLNRIDGSYNFDNRPAAKCCERLGFKQEGLARQYTWADGKYIDIVFTAMLRSEWGERQKRANGKIESR